MQRCAAEPGPISPRPSCACWVPALRSSVARCSASRECVVIGADRPVGQNTWHLVNPTLQKYTTLPKFGITAYIETARPTKRGGSRVVRNAGRVAVDAAASARPVAGRAGSPCESAATCGRTALSAYGKTVWSWPSLLRSSLRGDVREPNRADGIIQFAGRGRPEGTRLPGEHGISRPTTAQGRPGVRPHLYAAVQSFCAICAQRTAGAKPAPGLPCALFL